MSFNTMGMLVSSKIVFVCFLVASSEVSGIVVNQLWDRGLALGFCRLEPAVEGDVLQLGEVRLAAPAVVVVGLGREIVSAKERRFNFEIVYNKIRLCNEQQFFIKLNKRNISC